MYVVPHWAERRVIPHEYVAEFLEGPFETMYQPAVVVVRYHHVFRVTGRVDHLQQYSIFTVKTKLLIIVNQLLGQDFLGCQLLIV